MKKLKKKQSKFGVLLQPSVLQYIHKCSFHFKTCELITMTIINVTFHLINSKSLLGEFYTTTGPAF